MIASTPIDDDSYRGEMIETHPREVFSERIYYLLDSSDIFWMWSCLCHLHILSAIYGTLFDQGIHGILGIVCLILFSVVLKLLNREYIVCVPPSPITHNNFHKSQESSKQFFMYGIRISNNSEENVQRRWRGYLDGVHVHTVF